MTRHSFLKALGGALLALGAAFFTAPAPAVADQDINAWGKPEFEKGDKFKAAIWRDDDGWHIRWTTAEKKRSFAGWISAVDGDFTKIVMVRKERGDWARVTPNDKRLVFDTTTEEGVDGFDFRSEGTKFTFNLLIDGKEMPDRVFIGANDRNPSKIPFTLEKWDAHPRDGKGDGPRGGIGDGKGAGRRGGKGDGGGAERDGAADQDWNAWGKPDFEKGDTARIGIWRDDDGWHIRWTTAGHEHRFHGTITTPGKGDFSKIVFIQPERGDWAKVGPGGNTLLFDTKTKGGVDGFDFRSDSASFSFSVLIDGKEMPERIFIGKNSRNPSNIPFNLDKAESHKRK